MGTVAYRLHEGRPDSFVFMATFTVSRDCNANLSLKLLVSEPEILKFVEKDEMLSSNYRFTSRRSRGFWFWLGMLGLVTVIR